MSYIDVIPVCLLFKKDCVGLIIIILTTYNIFIRNSTKYFHISSEELYFSMKYILID